MPFHVQKRVIDRFHVQKQALEAVQEIRIKHRWGAIDADTEAREQAKLSGKKSEPARLSNGDTLKELLARGRYALFKSPEKWTDSQRQRIDLMFSLYSDLKGILALITSQSHILQQELHCSECPAQPRTLV